MQVTNTIEKTRELVNNWKKEGKTIGLVPTMGYLHFYFSKPFHPVIRF